MALIELQTTPASRTYKCNRGTSFQLIGTITSETIDFKIPDGSGGWMDLYSDGTRVQLTATNNIVSFHAPADLQIVKPTTASNAGVTIVS